MRVFLAFILIGALHACVCWLYPFLGTAAFLGTMTIIASEWADGCQKEVLGMVGTAAKHHDMATEGGGRCCGCVEAENSDADDEDSDSDSNNDNDSDSNSDSDSNNDSDSGANDADDSSVGDTDGGGEADGGDTDSGGEADADAVLEDGIQCVLCTNCCTFCGQSYCDVVGVCQQVYCGCICRRCGHVTCTCQQSEMVPTEPAPADPAPADTEPTDIEPAPADPAPADTEPTDIEPAPPAPTPTSTRRRNVRAPSSEASSPDSPSSGGGGDALASLAVAAWQHRYKYATRAGQKRN